MNDEEKALVAQLIELEDKIFDAGIDGGILTSDAIDTFNEFMRANSYHLMKILRKL